MIPTLLLVTPSPAIVIPYDDDCPDQIAHPAVPFTLYHFNSPSIADIEEEVHLEAEPSRIYFHCNSRSRGRDAVFGLKCL
jgi:hypothetical protein